MLQTVTHELFYVLASMSPLSCTAKKKSLHVVVYGCFRPQWDEITRQRRSDWRAVHGHIPSVFTCTLALPFSIDWCLQKRVHSIVARTTFSYIPLHWLLLHVFLQPSFCCRGSVHCRAQQDRRRLFVFSDLKTRQRTKLIWHCFFKLLLLGLWDFFCPSSDTLIGSNFLLYFHQLKLRNCTEADKNLYINKGVESKHCKVHFLPFWSEWKGPSTLGNSS